MSYEVNIISASKPLSAKEKIQLCQGLDTIKLDATIKEHGELIITPAWYAGLAIHNDRAKNGTDYNQYIVVDDGGTAYSTGSEVFWGNFKAIMDMADAYDLPAEDRTIRIFHGESDGGQRFINCRLLV